MSFETIQEFYELGLWNEEQLKELVENGIITPLQFQEITGIEYANKPKEEVKAAPKGEPKEEVKEEVKATPKEEVKEEPRG